MPRSKPQLVAFLPCEQAFQQAGSGNWCIIGAYDTLNAPLLPFTLPQLAVYVALTDFAGDAVVELVIRDQEGAVVKAVRGEVPRIPIGLFQYVFTFVGVELKKAGVHTLELFAGGELLALRSIGLQTSACDPKEDEAEAEALDRQHSATLIKDAREVWSERPQAKLVGLIASVRAAQVPWFRRAFAAVFGGTPPSASFVGLLDPDTLVRFLGGEGHDVAGAIEPTLAKQPHALAIAIVTKGGFKFVYHTIED
jgi:hypothetical protein